VIAPLIAYDAAGNIVGVLDYWVRYDESKPDRPPIGLVDFAAMEAAGMDVSPAVWNVDTAVGSKVWPEWLGNAFGDYRVELDGPPGRKRIAALVHKGSGLRRERDKIEKAIAGRIEKARGKPADLRDLVGGPGAPLRLDRETGRTLGRGKPAALSDLVTLGRE
jgi:hypothetical protein